MAADRGERGVERVGMRDSAWMRLHRDLTKRLGFGDGVTEPIADNDTIVRWYDQVSADASEWRDSQLWRDECYFAGHPQDEDCWEHDPILSAEARVANAFIEWAATNEIAEPPLDWAWFGEIARRFSPLHEEHAARTTPAHPQEPTDLALEEA